MQESVIVESITHKAVRSVKWSALMEMVSRSASPIVTIVLARLLTPADFGIISLAMIFITFAQMFWDAGFSKAVIQFEQAPEKTSNVVFWTNLALSIILYASLFVSAPWIGKFFNNSESSPVLQVLGIHLIISSLSSVQQALFIREMNFQQLFWVKLLTAFIPGFVSIPMAYWGGGVWALVAGTIAGQTINMLLLWHYSSWQPKFEFDILVARKIYKFGFWVILESICGWIIMWVDSLIVGKYLGVNDLGVYRTGWLIVTVIFGLMLNPFIPIIFPTFSRFQNDLPVLKESFHKVNRIVITLSLPLSILLFFTGPELVHILFGNKWQGMGFVISILGLTLGTAWLVGVNPELYRAIGKPDVNSKIIIIAILYYIPTYWITVQYGLSVFVYARLGVAVLAIPIHIYLCRRIFNVSWLYLWQDGRSAVIASIGMAICIIMLKSGIKLIAPVFPNWFFLIFAIMLGTGSYVALMWKLDKEFVLQTYRLCEKTLKGS